MSKLLIALGIALATLGLTACESLDKKGYSREQQGTVGGAVAGGAVGAAATGGSPLGTVGGAVVGGVVGNEVGERYDEKKGQVSPFSASKKGAFGRPFYLCSYNPLPWERCRS